MLYRVQYGDGPALDIEAAEGELAWDEYKRRTGLRRQDGDQPPAIAELQAPALPAEEADA